MEMALRRRLEGVNAIAISQSQQTAEVGFAKGDHLFSPSEFRGAVKEAGVVVLALRIEACGVIEQNGSERWLTAGKNRFVLAAGETGQVGKGVCVSARLDDRAGPDRLEIAEVQPIGD
jgi:hypothetical protein